MTNVEGTCRAVLAVVMLCCTLFLSGLVHAQGGRPEARRVVVLSDLHMGEGRDATGVWSPFEDFRWSDEFELFLAALDAETEVATNLVLNGDTFELVQAEGNDCSYREQVLGCSEADALSRLTRVLDAHRGDVAALGAFARSGDNRLVLVPGDHDA